MLSIDSGNQFFGHSGMHSQQHYAPTMYNTNNNNLYNNNHHTTTTSTSKPSVVGVTATTTTPLRGTAATSTSTSSSSVPPRAPLPILVVSSTTTTKSTTGTSSNTASSSSSGAVVMPAEPNASSDWASMEKEVRAGAAWWRARARTGIPTLTAVQLDVFEKTLVRALAARFEGHWYSEEPQRGSAFRALVTDASVDVSVLHAATAAKITVDERLVASFTTMWINPGRVTVRLAKSMWEEDADVFQVFPESSPRRRSSAE